MKVHVVVCHFNNPTGLDYTLKNFRERKNSDVTFFIIDNGSNEKNLKLIRKIAKNNLESYILIIRENKNKEAGAYWHYITDIYPNEEKPDIIVFTQDELHQFPMAPKGRSNDKNDPFYPDYYGEDGIVLMRCYKYLDEHKNNQIGFGRHIIKEHNLFDRRWRTGYWRNRLRKLRIKYYLFHSGACFAIHNVMIKNYIELCLPTEKDKTNSVFPWMWERLWGTIPSLVGGMLVHYSDFSKEIKENNALAKFILRQLNKIINIQFKSV